MNTDGEPDFDTVKRCHAAILDQIVEMDENLMEKYLGGEEPDYGALHDPSVLVRTIPGCERLATSRGTRLLMDGRCFGSLRR